MCEKEKIICWSCGWEYEKIDEWDWPAISIEDEMVKITDFFCKQCGKIMYGYTKIEWENAISR